MNTACEHLSALSRRETPDLLRARAMGFELVRSDVAWTGDALRLAGHMRCVCGRDERFDFRIAIDPAALDPAKLLRLRGAFDAAHLRADGYSEADIADIVSKGAAL